MDPRRSIGVFECNGDDRVVACSSIAESDDDFVDVDNKDDFDDGSVDRSDCRCSTNDPASARSDSFVGVGRWIVRFDSIDCRSSCLSRCAELDSASRKCAVLVRVFARYRRARVSRSSSCRRRRRRCFSRSRDLDRSSFSSP